MSDSDLDTPDEETIAAWLSGTLSVEDRILLERQLDRAPENTRLSEEEEREEADTVLIRDLANQNETLRDRPEVTALIADIKSGTTRSPVAPKPDAWREILEPPPENADPELLGMLGRYEVVDVIATGGMGIVLKAYDPKLKRHAAIKALSPELTGNATARKRFLREARAAASLEHENILPIYDIDDSGTVPWFSMRHAGGGSLEDQFHADRSFHIDELKSIAAQAAAALQAAHDAGIVHRDIKPANILLDEMSDTVWVCDFGIARSTEDPALTYAGSVAGTPQYMSPEQAEGKPLDGRSDLFSLGAVLYRCATGQPPFPGDTSASVLRNLAHTQPVSATKINAHLPKWFERLLTNLLAKDPRDRFSGARDVIRAIEAEHAPRPKHRVRRRRRWIACGVALVLVSGLLQVPAVRQWANQALAAVLHRPFTIEGRLGAHSTLGDAIFAAKDGDTIILPVDEEIPVDNLQIPAGKSLALRSANSDERPVLTTEIKGAPGIITRSPLRLTGLDFRLNSKRDGDGIIKIRGTTVKIEDCGFVSRGNSPRSRDDLKGRTIELSEAASVEIADCRFDLQEMHALTIHEDSAAQNDNPLPALVTIKGSSIRAFYAINTYPATNAPRALNLEISDSIFAGQSFLKHAYSETLADIQCRAERCDFITLRSFCWFQTRDTRGVRARFQWSGKDNTYKLGNARVLVGSDGNPRKAAGIYSLSEFGGNARSAENGPSSRGRIEIESTGEKFTDLESAINRAPSGSTLLLSGEIVCKDIVYTRSAQKLNFRSAPGAKPVIVAAHPEEHALFIISDTTIDGITFVRHAPGKSALPILGIKDANATLVNCHFETFPLGPGNKAGIGLSFTNMSSCTVRSCTFRIPGGHGISLAFLDSPAGKMDLQLEDTLFIASRALERRAYVPNAPLSITAKRCVILSDYLLTDQSREGLHQLELELSDCIIDAKTSLLSLADYDLKTLREHLTWSGRNNFYRGGTAVLVTPQVRRKDAAFAATVLSTFEDFLETLPNTQESRATVGPLFDRSQLLPPLTPSVLLKATPESVKSPALETLNLLKKRPISR